MTVSFTNDLSTDNFFLEFAQTYENFASLQEIIFSYNTYCIEN